MIIGINYFIKCTYQITGETFTLTLIFTLKLFLNDQDFKCVYSLQMKSQGIPVFKEDNY